jgi:hypothetical protein
MVVLDVADNVAESGVEVDYQDSFLPTQLLFQDFVVQQGVLVGNVVTPVVVGLPAVRRRAAERVQVVHQDPLHPEVSQPLHIRDNLRRDVPDKTFVLKVYKKKTASYGQIDHMQGTLTE